MPIYNLPATVAELGNVFLILLFLQKLSKKHQEDPEKFKTIQDIVNSEIEAGTTKAKNSATDALLWLKRYIYYGCTQN